MAILVDGDVLHFEHPNNAASCHLQGLKSEEMQDEDDTLS